MFVSAMMNSYWCSNEYVAFLLAANCSSNLFRFVRLHFVSRNKAGEIFSLKKIVLAICKLSRLPEKPSSVFLCFMHMSMSLLCYFDLDQCGLIV